jgi:hypothetical protein
LYHITDFYSSVRFKLFTTKYNRLRHLGTVELTADNSVSFKIAYASFYVLSADLPTSMNGDSDDSETDTNPPTGVVLGFTAVSLAGIVTLASKRRKKYNKDIKM